MKKNYLVPLLVLIIFIILLTIGFNMFDSIKSRFAPEAATIWLSKKVYDNPNTVNVYLIDFFPKNPRYPTLLDVNTTGIGGTSLSTIRARVKSNVITTATNLSNGSAYRRYPNAPYKNLNSKNYLNYNLVNRTEFLEPIPLRNGFIPGSTFEHYPDYNIILGTKLNICDLVDRQGIDEIWINSYHYKDAVPVESNMSMGRVLSNYFNHGSYGDISNSYQENDLPQCNRTYTVYTYNYGRTANEMVHNHIHQFEVLLNNSLNVYSANTFAESFKFQDLVGKDPGKGKENIICGNAHFTLNSVAEEYSYNRTRVASSNCNNLTWAGEGKKSSINCSHWGCTESGWYRYWMNSLPGNGNQFQKGGLKVRNFWEMISSLDNFIINQTGKCEFSMIYNINSPVPINCQLLIPIIK